MNYIKNIVKKPWGFEYLAYENKDVAIWILHIQKGQSTSMHCHPKKTTGLVVLDGIAEISFLADKKILKSVNKVMIRRGLFHKTEALTDVVLLEIETPKDKHDLVRLNDSYGRQSKSYENESFEYPKQDNSLWIDDHNEKLINYANCNMKVKFIKSIEQILEYDDNDVLVFMNGGLIRQIDSESHLVTVPGDVGFGSVVKDVAKKLDGIKENTIVLSITKN